MAGEAAASQGGGESAPDLSAYDERLGNMEKDLSSSREEARQANEKLGKMRDIWAPKEEAKDPGAEYDDFVNSVLDWSLENQKQGKGSMPITTTMAVKLAALAKSAGKSDKEIAQLKAQIQQMSDPEARSDQKAFETLDSNLIDAMERLYGKENFSQERFSAVASEITKEIKRLKSSAPEQWNQIKRSPKYLSAMVEHFTMKAVPNRARQAIEKEELDNYEMTPQEIVSVIREAQEIKDPKARGEVVKKAREELWKLKFEGGGRRRA